VKLDEACGPTRHAAAAKRRLETPVTM